MLTWGSAPPPRGKAAGASPLNLASLGFAIGVQHPLHRQSRRSLPAHTSLRSVLPLVQHPLHRQSRRSLPAQPRFAQLLPLAQHPLHRQSLGASPLNLASLSYCRWLSAPSTGRAVGASPLNLACSVIAVAQRPLHRQSRRSLPAHTSLRSTSLRSALSVQHSFLNMCLSHDVTPLRRVPRTSTALTPRFRSLRDP